MVSYGLWEPETPVQIRAAPSEPTNIYFVPVPSLEILVFINILYIEISGKNITVVKGPPKIIRFYTYSSYFETCNLRVLKYILEVEFDE